MAKPNFNLSGVLGDTKSTDTHTKETLVTVEQGTKKEEKKPLKKEVIKLEEVKKCLLQIPISQHRLLKKFCAVSDLKVSEFILLAIKEKLER